MLAQPKLFELSDFFPFSWVGTVGIKKQKQTAFLQFYLYRVEPRKIYSSLDHNQSNIDETAHYRDIAEDAKNAAVHINEKIIYYFFFD